MEKLILLIRSLLFDLSFALWTAIIGILWLPITLWVTSTKVINALGFIWAHGSLWLLQTLCGIRVNVVGLEHIPKRPCIIASKHESAWETIFFLKLLVDPVFVLKKELIKIPCYGWHLRAMGMVCIDREDGIASIKQALIGAKKTFENNRHLVIFPEGTRTLHGEINDIKSGIIAIHNKFPSVPIIPAALDSGLYWNNRSWIKKPGIITLQFKPAIQTHLSKDELRNQLARDLNLL